MISKEDYHAIKEIGLMPVVQVQGTDSSFLHIVKKLVLKICSGLKFSNNGLLYFCSLSVSVLSLLISAY